jgi:uncharacterized protein YciI
MTHTADPRGNEEPASVAACVALYTAGPEPTDPTERSKLWHQHLDHLSGLHEDGLLLFAGPFGDAPNGPEGFAVFPCSDLRAVESFVQADPAVGQLLTTTVRPWTPVLGLERLPRQGEPGIVIVEKTVRRLFVDGVAKRDAEAYFDRTYHPGVTIHEAPSLPYGGEYHGLKAAGEHALAFIRTFDALQGEAQRDMSPRIIATDSEAFVVWTLRAQRPGDPEPSEFPALSHYRFEDDRIIEARMCLFDTAAVVKFLQEKGGLP